MKQSKLKNSVINSNQVKCSTKLNDTISSNRSHKTIKSNKSLNSVKKSKDTIIKVVANKIKDIDENKENKEINSNKNSSKIKVSNNTLKPQNFNSTINSKNNNSILHITNTSVISGISETVFNNNNIIKWPKIFHCIIKGTIKDTLKAIKQGENVNSQLEYGETPLLQAVELDKLDQAKLLLKFKADVNLSNNDGLTPLHVAVYRKNSQMVKLLLDFKADTNIQNRYFLQTSLHTCCISNSTAEIFYLLIHFGGNPTIKDYQNKKPFEYVTKDSELNKAIEKLKTSSFTQLNIQSLKEKNDISQDGMHSKRSKFEIENFSTSKMINIMNNTVNSSFEGNESAIQYFNTCQTNQSNSNIIVFNQLNYDNNNISEINYLNDMNCAEVTNKEFLKDEHFNVSNNNIIANSFVDKTYMPNLPMNSFFQFSRISGSNINSQNHTRNNSEVIKVEENSKQSSEESKKKDKSNEIEQNKLYNVNGNNSTFNLMFNNCSINYSNLSNSNNEILDQNKSIQQKTS